MARHSSHHNPYEASTAYVAEYEMRLAAQDAERRARRGEDYGTASLRSSGGGAGAELGKAAAAIAVLGGLVFAIGKFAK